MRFKGLDLNLLVAFDALLETRSVSRAAERLHLSQPAISAALKRLRQYFGDDLLVTHGTRMFPSALAEALLPQVRECLAAVDGVISTSTRFHPAQSRRTFRIAASDYVITAVLAPMVRGLAQIAPGLSFELLMPSEISVAQLKQGELDMLVTPEDYLTPDMPSTFLFEDRFVVIGWAGNPLFDSDIDVASFLDAGHVVVTIGAERTPTYADRRLSQMGVARRVEIMASTFNIVPVLLHATNRLAVMHERLARAIGPAHALRTAPLPFEIAPMREMAQFHRARKGDAGLMWLLDNIRDEASVGDAAETLHGDGGTTPPSASAI